MTNLLWELFGAIGYCCYFARWVFQIRASKKEKRSVTPINFWILSALGAIILAIYGYGLGSIIMPVTLIFTLIIQFYNIRLELIYKNAKKVVLE